MRKAETIYKEYKEKGRSDTQILTLATAINRADLREYVESQEEVDPVFL